MFYSQLRGQQDGKRLLFTSLTTWVCSPGPTGKKREPALVSGPLTFTCAKWYMHATIHTYIHTHTCKINK